MNDVIMSDEDCTPGREPCSIAASNILRMKSTYGTVWYGSVQVTPLGRTLASSP